jgi:hypothetical protein
MISIDNPEESGRQARREGMLRFAPFQDPALNRRWITGYDEVQAMIEARAQWMREHAATVDEWGFV